MEWESGSIYIRPNYLTLAGDQVSRHTHNFDHTTFVRTGWCLARARKPGGEDVVMQFASPDFSHIRELQLKYEPEAVLRPVRFPDVLGSDGLPVFVVRFIGQSDPVPDGAEEIIYAPVAWHALILAEVEHEFFALSSPFMFDCVYSHHNAQGELTLTNTGWEPAYV